MLKLIKLFSKKERFFFLNSKGFYKRMGDEEFIKKSYRAFFGKDIDLKKPNSFNEKTQWLKLNDRKEEYSVMADKYEAKNFIKEKIGGEHIIPTLGVWDSFDKIDFESLPDKFVLKTTHDSGGVIIVEDKEKINLKQVKKKLTNSLKHNYYYSNREYPYKNIKPRIMAETFVGLSNGRQCPEYKFFCFNGTAKLVLVCQGAAHGNNRTNTFLDCDFNIIPVDTVYKRSDDFIKKPVYFEKMKKVAEKLAHDMLFLRVDFYCLDDQYFIGELTFYHNGGLCPFNPPEYSLEFGKMLTLPFEKEV